MVKFLERKETDGITLDFKEEAARRSIDELTQAALKKGHLNLGYHYILRKNGELEKGIPLEQYANMELEGADKNIVVLVASASLTDAQRLALSGLSSQLGLEVKQSA